MPGSIALWTQLTHHLNSLVWVAPLPKRVRARVSEVVYRNPPMPAWRAAEAVEALDEAGAWPVVMGGWGIDALTGRQRRTHRDLDLIVDVADLDSALDALDGLGYEEWFRHPEAPPIAGRKLAGDVIALWDEAKRVVELHPLELAGAGLRLTHGRLGACKVLCLAPEQVIGAHQGFRNRRRSARLRDEENLAAARELLPADAQTPPG